MSNVQFLKRECSICLTIEHHAALYFYLTSTNWPGLVTDNPLSETDGQIWLTKVQVFNRRLDNQLLPQGRISWKIRASDHIYIADIRPSVVTGSIVHHLSEKSDKIHDFQVQPCLWHLSVWQIGSSRVFPAKSFSNCFHQRLWKRARNFTKLIVKGHSRLFLDVSSICWQKGERMTLKL